MPAAVAGHVGEQLGWEQLLAVIGEEGVHRPRWDQVAAPGHRVQLVIGGMALGHMPGSLPGQSQQRELPNRHSQRDRPNHARSAGS